MSIKLMFRFILLGILFCSFQLYDTALEQKKTLTSRITSATVYSDRAMVTKKASEQFTIGTHSVRFPHLPSSLFDQSVRVAAEGTAPSKILEVRVETSFLDTIAQGRVKSLQDKLKALNDEVKKVKDRADLLNRQQTFLNKITELSADNVAREMKGYPSPKEDLQKFLTFYEVNYSKLNAEMQNDDPRLKIGKSQISQSLMFNGPALAAAPRPEQTAEADCCARDGGCARRRRG